MGTGTSAGSEQGQRKIGHFRSSNHKNRVAPPSPEIERFTVLCASYSMVVPDNRSHLPPLLVPEINELASYFKRIFVFFISRVSFTHIYIYIYVRIKVFKKKLWILLFILSSPRGWSERSPAKFSIEPSDGSAVFLPRLVQGYTISRITLTVLDLSPGIIPSRGLTVWLRSDETESRLPRARKRRGGHGNPVEK